MKTFLTLCTFAMISAGIYGFADMTSDVRHGTMIEYDRGEKTQLKAVTIDRLKMAQAYKLTSIFQNAPTIDLKDKIINAQPQVAAVAPVVSAFYTDYTESFSRAAPVEYSDPDFLISPVTLLTAADTTIKVETTTSTTTETTISPVTENAGTDQPISVALATTEQPIYVIPPVDTTTLKAQTVVKPEPVEPIYEYYGRGNPG
ncbi:MAG TPA: hypothetical protein VFJ43_13010, partial [Bacteroidia bacterium]|nr:hypothetical protein [Bacteroidia bacterium]